MEKVDKVVSVAKHASELSDALVVVAVAVKKALADGWQPGQDIPAILGESYKPLIAAMSAVAQIPAEAAEDKVAVAKALVVGALETFEALK